MSYARGGGQGVAWQHLEVSVVAAAVASHDQRRGKRRVIERVVRMRHVVVDVQELVVRNHMAQHVHLRQRAGVSAEPWPRALRRSSQPPPLLTSHRRLSLMIIVSALVPSLLMVLAANRGWPPVLMLDPNRMWWREPPKGGGGASTEGGGVFVFGHAAPWSVWHSTGKGLPHPGLCF